MANDTTKEPAQAGAAPLRVYFDQNCMNARGRDPELQRIQKLHDTGRLRLEGNPRNYHELGDGSYAAMARERLAKLHEGFEGFRLDISPLDETPMAAGANIRHLFLEIFGRELTEEEDENSLMDVLHIANAEDNLADVFITREKAILNAREDLEIRVQILSPTELLAEMEDQ
jgi:hypothetical protein